MTVFMTLFDIKEKPITVQLSSVEFYIRAISFIVMGVFFLGYMGWREKVKRQDNP